MVGGTTSGYSLIGSRNMAINPTMKMIIESTPAKIGRRMKKCGNFMSFAWFWTAEREVPSSKIPKIVQLRTFRCSRCCYGLTLRHAGILAACHRFQRRHGHAGTNVLQAVDDDHFARRKPGTDDALAA